MYPSVCSEAVEKLGTCTLMYANYNLNTQYSLARGFHYSFNILE